MIRVEEHKADGSVSTSYYFDVATAQLFAVEKAAALGMYPIVMDYGFIVCRAPYTCATCSEKWDELHHGGNNA